MWKLFCLVLFICTVPSPAEKEMEDEVKAGQRSRTRVLRRNTSGTLRQQLNQGPKLVIRPNPPSPFPKGRKRYSITNPGNSSSTSSFLQIQTKKVCST